MKIWLAMLFTLAIAGCGSGGSGGDSVDAGAVRQSAQEAYIYGYPLVLMERTRQVSTGVPKAEGSRAPMNQYAHIRTFPDPNFKDVVSPNVDTLYSIAWIDLRAEPMVVSVPDARDYAVDGKARYYLLQMLDAWTNVFDSPGVRTRGPEQKTFLLTGPGWKGSVPSGMERIASPTSLVWVTGRTQVIDTADLPRVHAFQNELKLVPLSRWDLSYVPPTNVPVEDGIDFSTSPVEQVEQMSAQEFFNELSGLMLHNPAAAYDAPMLQKLEVLGIVPGQPFELSKLAPTHAAAVVAGYAAGRERLRLLASRSGAAPINGWTVLTTGIGKYDDDYDVRAVTAMVGLGANLPEDAVYPRTAIDGTGDSLSTAHQYTLTFEPGKLPPNNAFWSLTLYDASQALVANPISRYAVGSGSGLMPNADGSLTIYVQRDAPANSLVGNWLPAPQQADQRFNLTMRVYWPKEEMLNGDWVVPPVVRVGR